MRLHRFYLNTPISGKTFDVTDRDLIHQWRSVFRYNVGSQVILFDGTGTDYLCIISSLRNLGATLTVLEKTLKKNDHNHGKNIWICLGIIKKDNFELVVQKVTELGVAHIVPVLCERSEKKNIKLDRLQKIAIEASEQSNRGDIPYIHNIVEFSSLLKGDLLPNRVVFLDTRGKSFKEALKNENPNELAIFVGPEGGWSDAEVKEFAKHNIPSISLGSQILRAETAAIAVSSLLLL